MFLTKDDYKELEGLDLSDGWSLGRMLAPGADATGSTFSIGFEAKHSDGRQAFCKVLDLISVARSGNVIENLQRATKAFTYEWELLKLCKLYSSRRIVHALEFGEVADARVPLGVVPYIVFEEASGDLRSYLDQDSTSLLGPRVALLHDAAMGVRELHAIRIAHQDLKPSNLLFFEAFQNSPAGKLADLGRASLEGDPALHDSSQVAGAFAYAPPELLYGDVSDLFETRRMLCDFYQVGALIAYVLSEVSINGELFARLPADHHWRVWGGTYEEALPLVINVMNEIFDEIEATLAVEIKKEAMTMIRTLCNPNPAMRGLGVLSGQSSRALVMLRVANKLDLIAKRARANGLRAA